MSEPRALRLAIVGGGTGGHVVPGLHLLEALLDDPARAGLADLVWFETGRRAEVASLARLEGRMARGAAGDPSGRAIPIERVRIAVEPPGGGAPGLPRLLLRTPGAFLRARRALGQHRPDLLFGLGGFTLLPAVLAARSLGIPVVLLEINAQPGRAVRTLTPLAQRVFHAWGASMPAATGARHVRTGPPLSPELSTGGDRAIWRKLAGVAPAAPLLVVLGGSQGALALNAFVRAHAARWTAAGVGVIHQVGPGRSAEAHPALAGYHAVEFVDDMPGLLGAATLGLCRAGASTLAELAALGVPAIVVPYPGAGGHQRDNARELEQGLEIVEQDQLGPATSERVLELIGPAGAAWRAAAARVLRERVPLDAAARILDGMLELVEPDRPAPRA